MNKLLAYLELMRWHSPFGALLLLVPVSWSLLLAYNNELPLQISIVIILGAWFSRSLGCVINDLLDCEIDRQVARTKNRPLANGRLSKKEALFLLLILAIICCALLLTLTKSAIFVGLIATILVLIYPLGKRFFIAPQIILAMAFSSAIVVVYASKFTDAPFFSIPLDVSCWLLYLANVFWTVAYDTQYAMLDKKDDIKAGVKSTAILFGNKQQFITSVLLAIFLALMVLVGKTEQLGNSYYISLVIASMLLYFILKKVRGNASVANYGLAFKLHVAVGFIITGGIWLG